MKISKELKFGGVAIFAVALLYWGVNFLKGNDIFSNARYFYVEYENVEGLSAGKAVTINGISIGQIDQMYLNPEKAGKIVIMLSVNNDFPIPANTVANIHAVGLLGEKNISLSIGDSDILAESGDTLAGNEEDGLAEAVNKQVGPLKERTERLLSSIDTAVVHLSGLVGPESQSDFQQIIKNLNSTTHEMEMLVKENRTNIKSTLASISVFTKMLDDNKDNLALIINNFANISDTIAKSNVAETLRKLNSVTTQLDQITYKINKGEGTVGKLVNDPSLYNELNDATESLNRLLLDLRYNPSRYIDLRLFGSDRKYTPEEIDALEKERKNHDIER